MNNLKKYSADLERTLITTPLIRRNKNGTVVLQESILKSRIKKLENLIEKALTPPTSEEVCEALGEYYHGNCEYKDNRFFIKYEGTICAKKENGEIILNFATTPKLGKMIFDFYEEAKE